MSFNINLRSLMPEFFKLSKTTLIKGMQCELYLYLLKHRPKEKTPHDALTLQKFDQGKSFEARFKDTFPGGIAVDQALGKDIYAIGSSFTKAIFEQGQAATLFEACFLYRQTLVMADVCQVYADGSFDLYEVKNGTEAREVFLRDMAIQYYVIKNTRQELRHFYLVLNDGEDGFVVKDMTETLEAELPRLEALVPRLLQTLLLPEAPEILMGAQCHKPYDCEYIAYCTKKK
ncbi:MAG: hypothetical protein BGO31_13980 [Bacteroidetes bacterium 43-16]|nr:MAG: hypothetical protein BGO31_13980 [Bacteroidetes bacterium 43-16]